MRNQSHDAIGENFMYRLRSCGASSPAAVVIRSACSNRVKASSYRSRASAARPDDKDFLLTAPSLRGHACTVDSGQQTEDSTH
jgi:hypothetical protein